MTGALHSPSVHPDRGLYTLERCSGVGKLSSPPEMLFNEDVVACGTESGSLQLWTTAAADGASAHSCYGAFADIQVSAVPPRRNPWPATWPRSRSEAR